MTHPLIAASYLTASQMAEVHRLQREWGHSVSAFSAAVRHLILGFSPESVELAYLEALGA